MLSGRCAVSVLNSPARTPVTAHTVEGVVGKNGLPALYFTLPDDASLEVGTDWGGDTPHLVAPPSWGKSGATSCPWASVTICTP